MSVIGAASGEPSCSGLDFGWAKEYNVDSLCLLICEIGVESKYWQTPKSFVFVSLSTRVGVG